MGRDIRREHNCVVAGRWFYLFCRKGLRQKTAFITLPVACILFPLFLFSQTCVIVKKTRRAIYVGADSRVSRYSQSAVTRQVYVDTLSVCKIYHAGNVSFALIGAYMQEAKETALEQCAISHPFDSLTKDYAKSFDSLLSRQLSAVQQQNPVAYQSILATNTPFVSQIIFFGVDHDTLAVRHIGFRVTSGPSSPGNTTVMVRHLSGSFNPDAAGHIEEIKDTLATKDVFKKGIRRTINRLIEKEALLHPVEVGGDIDIIKVTKRRTRWLQKKQSC